MAFWRYVGHKAAIAFTAALCVSAAGQNIVPFDNAGKTGELEVFAFDSYRHRLPTPNLSFEKRTGDRYLPFPFSDHPAKLPYGTYRMRATIPGFNSLQRTVEITRSYQVIVTQFEVGSIEGGVSRYSVRGSLPEKSRRDGCNLVRLFSPIADGESWYAMAHKNGGFTFDNVAAGIFQVVTLGKKGVCDSTEVTLTDSKDHVIVFPSVRP